MSKIISLSFVGAVIVFALAAGVVFGQFQDNQSPSPTQSPTASPTASPTVSPTPEGAPDTGLGGGN